MNRTSFFIVLTLLLVICQSAFASKVMEEKLDFNDGIRVAFNDNWLFSKGSFDKVTTKKFDDSSWQRVTLPHDWAIEGPFESRFNARNGGLPFHGSGAYRKTFKLAKKLKDKKVKIIFDGAMYNAHVYINGKFLGNRPFGYIAFEYDISKYLNYGDKENILTVTMSPEDLSARWYPGAGLYRDAWLEIDESIHLSNWDTFITTPEISNMQATVQIRQQINLSGKKVKAGQLTVEHKVLDHDGKLVVSKSASVEPGGDRKKVDSVEQLILPSPTRWSLGNPYLYTIESSLKLSGKTIDKQVSPLGIRTIEFDADKGFFLNGERVQIQGVCLHHDNGPLGAVANRRAIERKLQIMKSMGVNSIRTSHNPPSPILVELADKMGILMQVEAFDVWKIQKQAVANAYNKYFDQWYETDLRDMVRQFRNNPSVFMWSIGNEIIEQKVADGWKLAKELTEIAHDEDPSRLVTAGFNSHTGSIDNGLADQVDITGFNYKPVLYGDIKDKHPNWIIVANETSSITSTRGVYHFPLEKYKTHDSRHVTSFDIIGPPWAYPPDIEFDSLAKTPSVIGEYMWTGFDYLGEPTPYGGRDHATDGYWNADWPVRSSSFGAVDLVGFPKDRYYLYQSQWTKKPMVHVLPHWNWHGMEGQSIPVFAYTNAEQVELFVNGKSMGRKTKGVDKAEIPIDFALWREKGRKDYKSPYRLRWDVKYQPGSLKVVAYTDGKIVAEKTLATASHPAKVRLKADRNMLDADGQDLSYISVFIEDKDGNLNPVADNKVRFFVEGAGEIAAVGNGDSATLELFKTDYRRAFYGKAMLIVKSKKGQAGKIKVRAYSDRLTGDQITLESR